MNSQLSAYEHDVLLEASQIAAGNSVKSVKSVVGQKVVIVPPELLITSMEHIADAMGKPEDKKTIVLVEITGEAHGAIVLLVDPQNVDSLLASVDESLRASALEEMTNIVAGAALGGMSRLLGIVFLQTVPVTSTDMVRAVVNEIVSEIGEKSSQILCSIIGLKVGPLDIPVSLYLLFDEATTQAIINAGKSAAGTYNVSTH